jgi:hypothetical protein
MFTGGDFMKDAGEKARKEYFQNYYAENKERLNEYNRKWRAENPDKVKEYNERYWERKAQLNYAGV